MIAIIKVDSADFINRLDTEKFNLRMIPSTRIKFDSEDVKFYEPIFYNDVEVIDKPPEPDTDTCIFKSQLPEYFWDYIQECISTGNFPTEEELNPDNYLLKSSMPEFYWNFSKYALSAPLNILPDTHTNLCKLAQATPALMKDIQVYNWSDKNFSLPLNTQLTSPIQILTDSYKLPNNARLYTGTRINFSSSRFRINAICRITNKTARTIIASFFNLSFHQHYYLYAFLQINNRVINFRERKSSSSTITGSSLQVTLDSDWDNTTPVTIDLEGVYFDDTNENWRSIQVQYQTTPPVRVLNVQKDITIKNSLTGGNFEEIVGYYEYLNPSSTSTITTSFSNEKDLLYYHSIDYNNNQETIIKFDDSKILNDKLQMIIV